MKIKSFKDYINESQNSEFDISVIFDKPYSIDSQGRYSTDGNVNIYSSNELVENGKLKIAFHKVGGYFYASDIGLETLEGFPESIGEWIDVHKNYLTDLKHFPKFVGDGIILNRNLLTSLVGLPKIVNGALDVSANRLTNLKGCSSVVKDYFSCSENKELTSLVGGPSIVGSIENKFNHYHCDRCSLTSLKGAPSEVLGDFHCYVNQLTTLESSPTTVGGEFNCSGNKYLKTLIGGPTKVGGRYVCSYSSLVDIKGAPEEILDDFSCNNNAIKTIENGPKVVYGYFDIRKNTPKFTMADVKKHVKVKGKIMV
jgi:hypothetical protein